MHVPVSFPATDFQDIHHVDVRQFIFDKNMPLRPLSLLKSGVTLSHDIQDIRFLDVAVHPDNCRSPDSELPHPLLEQIFTEIYELPGLPSKWAAASSK